MFRIKFTSVSSVVLISSRSHSIELTECDSLFAVYAFAVINTSSANSVFNFNERNENVLRFVD